MNDSKKRADKSKPPAELPADVRKAMAEALQGQLYYILDENRQPVAVDLLTWGRWFEEEPDRRRVAETFTELCWVSTIFLGVDHNFIGRGPPILFETMVFDREPQLKEMFGKVREIHEDIDGCRYASWDDAEAGHNAMVRRLLKKEEDAAQLIKDAREFVKNIGDVAAAMGRKDDEEKP
jgi:hypothetical protein